MSASHIHGGGHGHGHCHSHDRFGYAFAVGVGLNLLLAGFQVAYGIVGHSVALLADAGHNLSDVVGLLLAWGASAAAKRPPSVRFTYGLRSSSILAALANSIILLVAVGAIALEAIKRLAAPEPVAGQIVMIVAAIGILINGGTALLFASGRKGDLNVRSAFTHLAADAGISAGVCLSGFLILVTGWLWLDPAVSLAISAAIVWGTWGLLRESANLALAAVPTGIEAREVRRHLEGLPGVDRIHDLHIWAMSTTETALTCHLVMPKGHPGDAFIAGAAESLHKEFGIHHTTLQIESGDSTTCILAPDHVI
jgi:cobalt-zinc-cadmium efflux system protein